MKKVILFMLGIGGLFAACENDPYLYQDTAKIWLSGDENQGATSDSLFYSFRLSYMYVLKTLSISIFQGYILHRQLQYIFNCSCSIYSSAVAVYIHFSGVLSCMFCSACCAFGAMRFWPPLMMQTNWGSSRSWSLSISSWYSLGIIQRRRHFTCERSALRFAFRYS